MCLLLLTNETYSLFELIAIYMKIIGAKINLYCIYTYTGRVGKYRDESYTLWYMLHLLNDIYIKE